MFIPSEEYFRLLALADDKWAWVYRNHCPPAPAKWSVEVARAAHAAADAAAAPLYEAAEARRAQERAAR